MYKKKILIKKKIKKEKNHISKNLIIIYNSFLILNIFFGYIIKTQLYINNINILKHNKNYRENIIDKLAIINKIKSPILLIKKIIFNKKENNINIYIKNNKNKNNKLKIYYNSFPLLNYLDLTKDYLFIINYIYEKDITKHIMNSLNYFKNKYKYYFYLNINDEQLINLIPLFKTKDDLKKYYIEMRIHYIDNLLLFKKKINKKKNNLNIIISSYNLINIYIKYLQNKKIEKYYKLANILNSNNVNNFKIHFKDLNYILNKKLIEKIN